VQTITHRSMIAVLSGILLASCSGTSGDAPLFGTPASDKAASARTTATARMEIKIPRRHRHRGTGKRGEYISAATKSIAISIVASDGSSTHTFNEDLTPASNPNCNAVSLVCRIGFSLKAGQYVGSFATFDGLLDARHNPTGAELSANQNVPFTFRAGKLNTIAITLGGIPASAVLVPSSSSTLTGNSSVGYSLSRCGAAAQHVSVYAVDADGNYILGPGAPAVSLATSDATQLAVSPPSGTTPNQFQLTPPLPPNYPGFGAVVRLSATVTPSLASGGTGVTSQTLISYTSAVCGVITEYPVPTASSSPYAITVGPDGAIWFSEITGNKIGRIPATATVGNPQITEYPIPTANSAPTDIAAGSDGALWFTEHHGSNIGHIPTTGSPIVEYPTTTNPSSPYGIAAGPDGAMWFTECVANQIGRIPTTGVIHISEYSVPTPSSNPQGIAFGPGPGMWFVEEGVSQAGLILIANKAVAEYPMPNLVSAPRDIALGPDGAMWFAGSNGVIGRVPATGTPMNEVDTPEDGAPQGMTAGPDGAMWFVEFSGNSIGRISTSDFSISTISVPTANAAPRKIVRGPDGSLWFTEFGANAIGRLQ
jgi:virginiamycin B lyase